MPITRSLRTTIGKQNFLHQYLNAPQYPVNLMGCDVLVKCGASVLCGPDGLTVTFPDRTSFQCSAQPISPTTQMPLQPDTSPELAEWEDIYAGLLEPESKEKTGVLSLYQDWTKWIDMLHPYAPPPNPLHVTLYYDRDQDDVYKDAFTEQIQGVVWHITSSCLYSGSEGVAAPVDLINEQMEWYEMAETADLHVSLAIRVSHQAKDLGPMVKRLNSLTDWAPTNVSGLFFSLSDGAYKIVHATRDVAILQHSQIERFHGRERTDHPDTEQILQTLPHQLWSQGLTDVGRCNISPISFDLKDPAPIWQPQYRHKPEAEEGISETILGLRALQFLLEHTHSARIKTELHQVSHGT